MARLSDLEVFAPVGHRVMRDDDWVPQEWPVGFVLARKVAGMRLLGKMSWPDLAGGVFVGEIQRREWV